MSKDQESRSGAPKQRVAGAGMAIDPRFEPHLGTGRLNGVGRPGTTR